MASSLFLLISVSRRWYVLPNGRLDHTERSIRCSLATLDLEPRLHVVHFFAWDEETGKHYAEVGCRGNLPEVTGFLKRAFSTGSSLPSPIGRGLAVPGSVLVVYPEIVSFLEGRGIPCTTPTGGFKRAVSALRAWEDETFWRLDLDTPFREIIFGKSLAS